MAVKQLITLASFFAMGLALFSHTITNYAQESSPAFSQQYFHLEDSDRILSITPQGQLVYGFEDNEESGPLKLSYNQNSQIQYRDQCLGVDTDTADSELVLTNCDQENTQFSINIDGTIQLLNTDLFISSNYNEYLSRPIVSSTLLPDLFTIQNHPYNINICDDNQLLIEGNCICNPNIEDNDCIRSEGQNCDSMLIPLNFDCITLDSLSRINWRVWQYFSVKFWK